MILVTGPTGSGKTTTLYALIKMLNQPQVNIMTIEDPVEYRIAGVNQIQVNTATNLTFAKGLRSIIRQDPDVVLVGEIRDTETAEIAVNAALTGHLMLSTFHANDAATAIPRLLNMNVEPFLLASTLELIVAQRLVRRICEHCRRSVTYSQSELTEKFEDAKNYFTGKTVTLYEGKGCEACSHTGYKGRLAVFEFIKVTAEIENLILENPASKQIWELARTQGTRSMFEDGIDKVKNGITTIDELLRVTEPPELGSKK
jgi:type IV pilus assembly protein PilB